MINGLGSSTLTGTSHTRRCTSGCGLVFCNRTIDACAVVVFFVRKAKRTEVEKEYRNKATSVPQDLLRWVIYIFILCSVVPQQH